MGLTSFNVLYQSGFVLYSNSMKHIFKLRFESSGFYFKNPFIHGKISFPGTPSLCEPRTIENLINEVHGLCNVKSDLEVSLEANPSSNYLHKLMLVYIYL